MSARLSPLPGLAVLWLVFAVPLAVFKAGNDYVITPKISLAMAGVIAVWAALAQGTRWRGLMRQPLFVPLLAWVFAGFLAVPGSVNMPQAVRVALEQAGWAALALAVSVAPVSRARLMAAAGCSVLAQFVVALLQGSGQWVVGHGEVFGAGRLYATLGNPSFLGIYLAPVAVLALAGAVAGFAAGRPRTAVWSGGVLALALYLLYRAQVVDAWMGMALGGALGLYLAWRGRTGSGPGRAAVVGALVAVAVGLWAAYAVVVPRMADRLDYLKVKAFSWNAAAWLWRDHPVLGAGPGGFQIGAPQVMAKVHSMWTGKWKVPPMFVVPHDEAFAHQDFLQMLSELGTVGFGLWLWALFVAARVGWRAVRRGGSEGWWRASLLGALAAFLPTMCLHFPLHLAPSAMVFWLCLGLAGRVEAGPEEGPATPPLPRLLLAAAAVLLCVPVVRSLAANAYLGTGYRMFLGGAPEQAVPWHDRFRALDPAHFEGRFYGGAIHQAMGNDARALEEYGAAVALYPGMQGALYNLGNLAFRRGRYAEAVDAFTRVLEINPCMVEALNNRGNSYGELDRHREAAADYLRAVGLRPGYADALYNLAVTMDRMGDRKDARAWLRRTLEADPGYEYARRLAPVWGVAIPKGAAGPR